MKKEIAAIYCRLSVEDAEKESGGKVRVYAISAHFCWDMPKNRGGRSMTFMRMRTIRG